MRVLCENCTSPYELPSGQEGKSGCPLCRHINVPRAVRAESTLPHPEPDPDSQEPPVKTMLYFADAERTDDPTTAIRLAIQGKSEGLPAQHSVFFRVLEGDQRGAELSLSKSKSLIGRDRRADIILRDPEVSSRHCTIEFYGQVAVIRDVGSTNGTALNGYLIKENLLKDGDKIQLGGTTLQFRMKPK